MILRGASCTDSHGHTIHFFWLASGGWQPGRKPTFGRKLPAVVLITLLQANMVKKVVAMKYCTALLQADKTFAPSDIIN